MSEDVLDKQPAETRIFTIDFNNLLNTGELVNSNPVITDVPPGELVLSGFQNDRATQVQFTAAGGVDKTTYTLTIRVGTSWNNIIETDVYLRIRQQPTQPPPFSAPADWHLQAGKRYLKGILNTLAPVDQPDKGVTQEDLDAAENYAWRVMVSKLIPLYDVSSWSYDPPIPLFEIWDMLASSYVIFIVGQRITIEGGGQATAAKNLSQQADRMLGSIIDPSTEGDRITLMGAAGALTAKRAQSSLPMVTNVRRITFFPSSLAESYQQMPLSSSVEGFMLQLGYLSVRPNGGARRPGGFYQ